VARRLNPRRPILPSGESIMTSAAPKSMRPAKVNLFVTCLADQIFPQVGIACVTVLERLGIAVGFPRDQTCCGQPAFNSGFTAEARPLVERLLRIFPSDVPVVVPSGSCTSMIRRFARDLFPDGTPERAQLERLVPNVFEFSEFLVDVLGLSDVGARWSGRVTYHDGCHALRELGIHAGPRKLLAAVRDLELIELNDQQTCCGFGGLFAVKFPHISTAILDSKVTAVQRTGAPVLVSSDAGCLMQIRGRLSRQGIAVQTCHLAEILAHTD
jgi:L-lactate dehydrogenase complex protein LldE